MREIRSVVEVLSSEEVAVIHASALRILNRTGFQVPQRECLLLCRECGAEVDLESQRVRLPGGLGELEKKGAPDLLARAHEMVESLAHGYEKRIPVCTPSQFEKMNEIVEVARKHLLPRTLLYAFFAD